MIRCENCGAILKGNKCEYCGTEYNLGESDNNNVVTLNYKGRVAKYYVLEEVYKESKTVAYRDDKGHLHSKHIPAKKKLILYEY